MPLRWRQPRIIFVNSMSDLFHEDMPEPFIAEVFRHHGCRPLAHFPDPHQAGRTPGRIAPRLPWPINVWMGVSVESPRYVHRIECLRSRPGGRSFPIRRAPARSASHHYQLAGIDWVIVGGESGPGARPMSPDWVREIRDACLAEGVPFFFKQWGGTRKNRTGRILDGRSWDEMPTPVLRQVPRKGPLTIQRDHGPMPAVHGSGLPCAD